MAIDFKKKGVEKDFNNLNEKSKENPIDNENGIMIMSFNVGSTKEDLDKIRNQQLKDSYSFDKTRKSLFKRLHPQKRVKMFNEKPKDLTD